MSYGPSSGGRTDNGCPISSELRYESALRREATVTSASLQFIAMREIGIDCGPSGDNSWHFANIWWTRQWVTDCHQTKTSKIHLKQRKSSNPNLYMTFKCHRESHQQTDANASKRLLIQIVYCFSSVNSPKTYLQSAGPSKSTNSRTNETKQSLHFWSRVCVLPFFTASPSNSFHFSLFRTLSEFHTWAIHYKVWFSGNWFCAFLLRHNAHYYESLTPRPARSTGWWAFICLFSQRCIIFWAHALLIVVSRMAEIFRRSVLGLGINIFLRWN